MILLITGGTRSGKSRYAQELALSLSDHPVHIATARVWDAAFAERIKRHQQERDERWTTIEETGSLASLAIEHRTCVLDCITLWLTNFFMDTQKDVERSLHLFQQEIDLLKQQSGTFILITNEIGMGVHAATPTGRQFTDLQGWANQYVAAKADKVILMVSGIPVTIKGN